MLAKQIADKLNIPHYQLDRVWFEAGGREASHKARGTARYEEVRAFMREKVDELTQEPAWVSDGWYKRLQPIITERADVLLFLDIPLWHRLFNHAQRILFTARHPEFNMWEDVKFFGEIIRRKFSQDPAMRAFVTQHQDKVVMLHSYKEIEGYLRNLK